MACAGWISVCRLYGWVWVECRLCAFMQVCILWWHSGGFGMGVVGIIACLVWGVCVAISAVRGVGGVMGV